MNRKHVINYDAIYARYRIADGQQSQPQKHIPTVIDEEILEYLERADHVLISDGRFLHDIRKPSEILARNRRTVKSYRETLAAIQAGARPNADSAGEVPFLERPLEALERVAAQDLERRRELCRISTEGGTPSGRGYSSGETMLAGPRTRGEFRRR
jgi:hypothetical protein